MAPKEIFFQINFVSEINFDRLDPKLFETGFLRDGVQPFLDNKDHFLADVPLRFLGRRLLLSLHQPNMSGFSFELNGPSLLFVASPKEELLPLEAAAEGPPWRAHDTRESLTLLSGEDASGRALEATKMQIRFISFKASEEIKFKLSKTAVPFLFFAEPRRGEALSCGELNLLNWGRFPPFFELKGSFFRKLNEFNETNSFPLLFSAFSQKDAEEVLLSLPGGPAFANCEATSERPGGFDCRAGLNGQHLDRSFGAWKTRGPGKKSKELKELNGFNAFNCLNSARFNRINSFNSFKFAFSFYSFLFFSFWTSRWLQAPERPSSCASANLCKCEKFKL